MSHFARTLSVPALPAHALLATLALSGTTSFATPHEPPSPRPSLALSAWDAGAVRRAREGALRKLGDVECRKLLVDFRHTNGRTLQESLDEWTMTAAAYAALIPFLDGSRQPLCRKTKTALVSSPGVRRIYVCQSFADLQVRQPGLAESMVIHELLHTLGLGENPPTSLEITQRVEARCR
jgi:hypothetical protein